MQVVVGVYSPNPEDATSLYRGYGPFGHLTKITDTIRVVYLTSEDFSKWSKFQDIDIVFLQRPTGKVSLSRIQAVKSYGCKVVVDYDDDYLHIPTNNKRYFEYSRASERDAILQICNASDLVIVSTLALKISYENSGVKTLVEVVNNAINLSWFPKEFDSNRYKSFIWRGLDSHEEDLRTYENSFYRLGGKYKDYVFWFLGYHPYFITDNLINPSKNYQGTIFGYFKSLSDINGRVGLVPLRDDHFNKCKSNIAALEMIATGYIPVVPNLPEFEGLGITYKENFDDAVEVAQSKHKKFRNELLEYVKSKYILEVTNVKRLKLLLEVYRG